MASHRRLALTRRGLLAGASASCALLSRGGWAAASDAGDPWQQAQLIVDRLAWRADTPERRRRELRQFYVTNLRRRAMRTRRGAAAGSIPSTTSASGLAPAPGSPDNYAAFASAIAACNRAGGGRVSSRPATGIARYRSHCWAMSISICERRPNSASSPNPADYAKYGPYYFGSNGKLVRSRWQGNDYYNFSPMVYAYGQRNIALTGEDNTSVLNGQAGTPYDGTNSWWTWKGTVGTAGYVSGEPSESTPNPLNMPLGSLNPALSVAEVNLIEYGTPAGGTGNAYTADSSYLPALSEAQIPISQRVFGVGHQLPPAMIEFFGCTGVLLQGYQVMNTPFWQHHPIACRDTVIRDVYANSLGPNNDGFDPEACNYVLVEGVTFNTGDDCIAIKSGKTTTPNSDPRRTTSSAIAR